MVNNIRLWDAMQDYLQHMEARGAAKGTIKSHAQLLRRATSLWGNIYVASIRPQHVDELFSTPGWAASTRNLYLGNFRGGFIQWARRNNYLPRDYDPTDGWKNVKVIRKDKTWLPIEEFPELLDAAQNPKERALIAIGLFTMCRGSEITAIRVADVDFDHDTIFIYRQKTREEDLMPMPSELRDELLAWFRIYEAECGPLHKDWYVVPAQGPNPMAHDHALGKLMPTGGNPPLKPTKRMARPYMCVQRAVINMGMDGNRMGVHLLRRSSARAYYDLLVQTGHDHALMRVGAILGHKDTKTTQIYLGVQVEREQRNAALAGKAMFPNLRKPGTVSKLRGA